MAKQGAEKRLIEAVHLAILGYEKATDNSVSSVVMMDDRGNSGDFNGTISFVTEDNAAKSKSVSV